MKVSYFRFILTGLLTLCAGLMAESKTLEFTFATDHEGWVGDFSDYPIGSEAYYELSWGWENLAPPNRHLKGLFISGNNHSDDLFMFFRRQLVNLKPNTLYDIFFSVTIDTNVAPGQRGVGGAPGEDVFFKVGASTEMPTKIQDSGHQYRLNVDKGNQSVEGKNAINIGNIANPAVDPKHPSFYPKQLSSGNRYVRTTSDENGKLWIFLGTDSGFEATTLFFVRSIKVDLKPCKRV
jgi:hypothetical protein